MISTKYDICVQNTPLWIDSINIEKTNEWPIKIGTIYKNQNKKDQWSQYFVTQLKPNELFELVSENGNYHVRYSYKDLNSTSSGVEYLEWVDQGELENPFNQTILIKLKTIIESRF